MSELFKTSLDFSKNSKNPKINIPTTDNQTYGWHKPDNNNNQWCKSSRFGRKTSSMTKFVDEMALTNREFSLF